MLNYYLQERSYMGASMSEIEQSFREIAKMLRCKYTLDVFYKYSSFLTTKVNKKEILLNVLFDQRSKIDPDVRNNLVGYVLDRIEKKAGPFASIEEFKEIAGESHHFIGARFANKKKYEISTHAEFVSKRENSIFANISSANYDKFAPYLYKNVEFVGAGSSMLASTQNFKLVINDLRELDKYVEQYWIAGEFSIRDARRSTGVDMSDESVQLKDNKDLRNLRHFYINQTIGWQYCYFHIKQGDTRIHFFPDARTRKIYVPYIGGHLSTVLYKC